MAEMEADFYRVYYYLDVSVGGEYHARFLGDNGAKSTKLIGSGEGRGVTEVKEHIVTESVRQPAP